MRDEMIEYHVIFKEDERQSETDKPKQNTHTMLLNHHGALGV